MQLRAVTQTSSQLHLIIILISEALALSDSCESICQSLYNEAVSINGSKCIRFLVSVPNTREDGPRHVMASPRCNVYGPQHY